MQRMFANLHVYVKDANNGDGSIINKPPVNSEERRSLGMGSYNCADTNLHLSGMSQGAHLQG